MNINISRIEGILQKLKRKDFPLFIALQKKINQIAEMDIVSINHFKNLRHDLSPFKRVQIGSFVLVFRVQDNTIIFEDFDHHDRIYKKRFNL